jgi:chromosome segregation protein
LDVYIKELQLVGFKSFQDKTTLRFSPRMNAVIGPNGCGKTNILDALRWVLGEQSFGLLRCARNDDLVFGGTVQIPATNMAEVRLVLTNDSLPDLPTEIEIKRRYFRSGESEYYLNRQSCRLKDIQEVFFASGIGTRTYSIFDLNQMREIIAGNIRKMFEEAATLAMYREAKADCQRKLDLTDSDMVRLDDIIGERERVVRSLKRQSGKLRVHERLKTEERDLRLLQLKVDYESASREVELVARDVESLEQAEAERLVDIQRLDAELQRQRKQVRALQGRKDAVAAEVRKRRGRMAELEARNLVLEQQGKFVGESAERADIEREELQRKLGELEQLFNRALEQLGSAHAHQQKLQSESEEAQKESRDAEQKLYELRNHRQTVREAHRELVERQYEARRRVDRLEAVEHNQVENETRLRTEVEDVRRRLGLARSGMLAADREVKTAAENIARERTHVQEQESQLTQVEEKRTRIHRELLEARDRRAKLEKELAVLRSAMPDLVNRCRELLGACVLGEISNYLEIDSGWERACEAVLQPVLQFLVVGGRLDAVQLTRLAEDGPDAGCGFVSPGKAEVRDEALPENAAIVGRLAEHVRLKPECPDVAGWLIGTAVVVRDDADLEQLVEVLPEHIFVTRKGYARTGDGGYVVAGPARGRLRLKRLVAEAAERFAERESVVSELAAREPLLEQRRVDLDQQLEDVRSRLAEQERRKSTLDARHEVLSVKQAELARDEARINSERTRVAEHGRSNTQELASVRGQLDGLTVQVDQQAGLLRRADEDIEACEQQVKELLAAAGELLAQLSDQRQQVSRLEAESSFARQTIEERRRKASELVQQAVQARSSTVRLEEERQGLGPDLEAARREIDKLEEKSDSLQIADMVQTEETLERNLTELRTKREQNQSLLMEERLRRHELVQRRKTISEEAATEYGTDIANFRPDTEEGVDERLTRVRSRLEALGRVNPLALEEYEQEKQELERLQAQREDVVAARENLAQTMAEIDGHARERFLETYTLVREQFKDVFRQMFLAGDADLVLLDESNPLESEIAIFARPRGKSPKRLEQLSDGEKALLAVSLLFAFYRVKPAPFCFLDEIDAPLDDANVGRFADYLKTVAAETQVIIITHNRLTVERADSLFGVTAEQPGVSKLVSVSLADYQRSAVGSAVN